MNRLFFVFLLLGFNHLLIAQSDTLSWFTDLEKAKSAAAENGQDILMVFAGSDWCKPCIQFKKDILKSADFESKMKDELVVLYLDFPARKKNKLSQEQTSHNEALAERFNKSGAFPKILLLDDNEKVLGSPEFKNQSPLEFIHELQPALTAQK